jgi:tetratricopeptide (TPR) repeat protein
MGRFADTQRYYQEANELFKAEGDIYGRAYSYCGLGNAARMRQEYDLAMQLFAKAEKLYGRIGDKASFAYTVWAMATVHKMLGDYERSAEAFARAQALFRDTRDHRGLIYCRLGVGELALLQGREKTAHLAFVRSLEQAERFGYHAEACHALAGLALVDPNPNWEAIKKAYRKCGLHFTPPPPPLNLP